MTWHKVEPIPIKGRARHRLNGSTYTDPQTKAHLKRVRDSWDGETYPEDMPLALYVVAYQQLPNSFPKRVISSPFLNRPDIDNVLKAVMDGLTGVAFADDKQIVYTCILKADRTRDIEGSYIKYKLTPWRDVIDDEPE